MTDRITMGRLRDAVASLNRVAGYPENGLHPGDTYRTVDGAYCVDAAYGGYRLCRYVGESGAERDITPRGNARATYDLIRAYADGFRAGMERKP